LKKLILPTCSFSTVQYLCPYRITDVIAQSV
jgi:hypothetical protein